MNDEIAYKNEPIHPKPVHNPRFNQIFRQSVIYGTAAIIGLPALFTATGLAIGYTRGQVEQIGSGFYEFADHIVFPDLVSVVEDVSRPGVDGVLWIHKKGYIQRSKNDLIRLVEDVAGRPPRK